MISTPQKAGTAGNPSRKALDYIAACTAELENPKTSSRRRTEINEDLAQVQQGRFVVLNGVKHFVMDEGPAGGPPVVLVHGWDCSSLWWHYITPVLNAAGYRTINYDLRGHGFSEDPEKDDYSINTFVEDLAALVDSLGLERFHVFSFSVGSIIATAFAARYPERVASVAFFNYGLFEYNPKIEEIGPKVLSFVFTRVLKRIKSWQLVYSYVRLTLLKNPVERRMILYGMLSLKDISTRAAYHAARSTMSKEVLGQLPTWVASLKMPTLLVAGSHDKVISLKSARRMAELLPDCTYFVMPHCGHLILGELPEQVAALLKMHIGRTDLVAQPR